MDWCWYEWIHWTHFLHGDGETGPHQGILAAEQHFINCIPSNSDGQGQIQNHFLECSWVIQMRTKTTIRSGKKRTRRFRVKPLMDIIRNASQAFDHPCRTLAGDERIVAAKAKTGMTVHEVKANEVVLQVVCTRWLKQQVHCLVCVSTENCSCISWTLLPQMHTSSTNWHHWDKMTLLWRNSLLSCVVSHKIPTKQSSCEWPNRPHWKVMSARWLLTAVRPVSCAGWTTEINWALHRSARSVMFPFAYNWPETVLRNGTKYIDVEKTWQKTLTKDMTRWD